MAAPVKTGFPDGVDLDTGYTIRFTALDPTSGAVVAGVTVSSATILAQSVGGGALEGLQVGPFMLVPGPES